MDFVNFFSNIGIPPDPVANEDTLRNHIGRIPYTTFQVSPPSRNLLAWLGFGRGKGGPTLQICDEVKSKLPS